MLLIRMARLHIVRDEGRTLEEYKKLLSTKSIEPLQTFTVELGTKILLADGSKVKKGQRLLNGNSIIFRLFANVQDMSNMKILLKGSLLSAKSISKQVRLSLL